MDDAGLGKTNLVEQVFDGATTMFGHHSGVQRFIVDKCPTAVYLHRSAHALNLCLAKASDVLEIRAAIATMHKLAVFHKNSNKRLLNLQSNIDVECQ
jgi:hypothetical protein